MKNIELIGKLMRMPRDAEVVLKTDASEYVYELCNADMVGEQDGEVWDEEWAKEEGIPVDTICLYGT